MEMYTTILERWPRPFTIGRKYHPFKSPWEKTLRDLKNELRHLEAATVILKLAVREKDLSPTSGMPRPDCVPAHPGVIVMADTKHGPLQWACDDCSKWRDNVRAIALTLERLRLADLYGVTRGGEQYAGWKMLPAPAFGSADGAAPPPAMSIDEAARLVAPYANLNAAQVLRDKSKWQEAFRAASKVLHPDVAGSDPAKWKKLQDAAQLLNTLHQRK